MKFIILIIRDSVEHSRDTKKNFHDKARKNLCRNNKEGIYNQQQLTRKNLMYIHTLET